MLKIRENTDTDVVKLAQHSSSKSIYSDICNIRIDT